MTHWVVRILGMALVGLLVGPILGTLIAEQTSGARDAFVAKEHGFVGFWYGLLIGPAVGAFLGFLLAASRRADP